MKLIIQASNVHSGGGGVLLTELLKYTDHLKLDTLLYVDSRYKRPEPAANRSVELIRPTILSRLNLEFKLKRQAACSAHHFLFFGNLPPLFPCGRYTSLFFQNTIMLKEGGVFQFPLKIRLKHMIERLWLRWGLKYISTVVVQSESVKNKFLSEFPKARVIVLPFAPSLRVAGHRDERTYDFLYVASGDPHKNHSNLLRAWALLGQRGLFPTLALTARLSSKEKELAEAAISQGSKISFLHDLSHNQVLELYRKSGALIFPSLTESFGLPLIEARGAGIPILASERDFVRDVVEPVQTFDPESPLSIARAVQRFLGAPVLQMAEVAGAEQFLKVLLEERL